MKSGGLSSYETKKRELMTKSPKYKPWSRQPAPTSDKMAAVFNNHKRKSSDNPS